MPRTVTKTCFSAGTTVDGSRIDAALNDAFDRINNLPGSDCANRLVPQPVVCGYSPFNGLTDAIWDVGSTWTQKRLFMPFLRHLNDATDPITATTDQNPTRFKGLSAPGVDAIGILQYWLCHTVRLANTQPTILDSVNVFLSTDDAVSNYYDNVFNWIHPAGSNLAGDALKDIHIIVDVFSPFDPYGQDVNLVSVPYHRYDFYANATVFTIDTVGAHVTPVVPFPTGFPSGLAITQNELGIPIPANSVLRFTVALPLYETSGGGAEYASWDENPVRGQSYSLNLGLRGSI